MSVLIVVGTIVLVGAIIWKASRLPAANVAGTGGFEALDVAVPPGATVRSLAIDGDRLAVTLEGARNEIVIVDIGRGEVVGRIRLAPEAPAAADGSP